MSNETLADKAEDSDTLDHVARVGLVAYGLVHLVMGWLALQLAFGDRAGETSSDGALRQLAEQPMGRTVVWLVAIGMVLLAIWQGIEAAVGHRQHTDEKRRLRRRLSSAGKVVVYVIIAISAFRVALGTGKKSGGGTESKTSSIMDLPAGQFLVGAVALGIAAVAISQIVRGVTDKFLEDLSHTAHGGKTGSAYVWFGRIGYTAKGLSLLAVAGLFAYAAISHDPKKSGGTDQALVTVLEQPAGPWLLGAIGVGIICFGLFCFAWARHIDR